ncbi:serine acetyltransferase [Kocuria rosea]|uniref:serine acetyltransferase n=1 Tax=Kocuria rosea TaxID=1275 RepID=UPI001304D4F0|nr:serine acetyltransferase [Kocuria rosea]
MGLPELLVAARRSRLARLALIPLNINIGAKVQIGRDLQLVHYGMGTVIYPDVTIGDRVRIYHQVTVGRKDAHRPREQSAFAGVDIGDDVVLFPGCKVLGGPGVTRIGNGTIVGANAVVLGPTGDNEIWVGNPARCVGLRDDR